LVREYLELHEHYRKEGNDRLALLVEPANPKKGALQEVKA
jgi:hypothetical protein